MLAAAIAAQYNVIHLPADMAWLGTWAAIICLGVAAVTEIGAYYIPFVDNLLDTIATPLSIGAGTVLASSILPVSSQEPLIRWGVALIAGGSTAGTIQLGTGLLRLLSSKTTAGLGNPVVATSENAAAATGSVLSFFFPVFIAGLLVILIGWIVFKLINRVAAFANGRKKQQKGKEDLLRR
jgi:hypothetical protein